VRVGDLVDMTSQLKSSDSNFCGLILSIDRGFYKRQNNTSCDRVHVLWNTGHISIEPDVCLNILQQEKQ